MLVIGIVNKIMKVLTSWARDFTGISISDLPRHLVIRYSMPDSGVARVPLVWLVALLLD